MFLMKAIAFLSIHHWIIPAIVIRIQIRLSELLIVFTDKAIERVVCISCRQRAVFVDLADIPVFIVLVFDVVRNDIFPVFAIAEIHRKRHVGGIIAHIAIV